MGRLLRILLPLTKVLPAITTLAALAWVLSMNALAQPMVERGARDLALTLERQVARRATAPWINAELAAAVAAEDLDRVEMLLTLADELGRPVDRVEAKALLATRAPLMTEALTCGACMVDIATCPTLRHIATCAAPFELSPLGDLNALRRAGLAWASQQPVDRLDATLALVGLGATAAVVASGGTSTTVKAGTALLRMARRMGSLTPAVVRLLRVPIRWQALPGYLAGQRRLGDVTDLRQLAVLGALANDMDRVRRATSTAEALRLMRLVETPEDAARLARLAEAAGPRTGRTLAVLGKSRAFRATLRLGGAAASALILMWALAVQLAVALGSRFGALALRAMVRAIGPTAPPR